METTNGTKNRSRTAEVRTLDPSAIIESPTPVSHPLTSEEDYAISENHPYYGHPSVWNPALGGINPYNQPYYNGYAPNGWIAPTNIHQRTYGQLNQQPYTTPKSNIYEDEKSFKIEFAVPNKTKNDFKIRLERGVLSVSEKINKKNGKESSMECTRREFWNDHYHRSFILPEFVDTQKIQAKCNNGILTLTIPKKSGKAANEIAISN